MCKEFHSTKRAVKTIYGPYIAKKFNNIQNQKYQRRHIELPATWPKSLIC